MMKCLVLAFLFFSLSVSLSAQSLKDCKKTCERTRVVPYGAFIGVQIADIPGSKHVLVTQVIHGTAAQAIGIRAGDTLFYLDGLELENTAHLLRQVSVRQPGDEITLVLHRNGEQKEYLFPLGARFSRMVTEVVCCDEEEEASINFSLSLDQKQQKLRVLTDEVAGGELRMDIINERGQLVQSKMASMGKGAFSAEVDVRPLPSGTYFVKLVYASQQYIRRFELLK